MLTISGQPYSLCDGVNRRSFLKIGGLAMGGLTLPQLLAAEQAGGRGKSHKAVIMIFLSGGPPHQDMFDLKMDAPAEIRGEFQPISTRVPGIQICEHLPRMAQMMDKLVPIRSLVGSEGRHAAFQCLTGWPVDRQPAGGWPSFGSVVSKLKGTAQSGTPPFVSLTPKMKGGAWGDPGQPGFVGQAHSPFTPNAEGQANLVLNGITLDKLRDRQALMQQLDRLRRDADASGAIEGMDAYYQQAFGILTSSRLAEALDLEREDPRLRDRYGRGSPEPAGYGDAGPLMNDYFLAARRLVEAGVRVVSLAYGRWDWHGRPHGTNFDNARDHLPQLDQGVTALLEDLEARGMSDDVSVVVWGEFGRTPRINKNGGRDHWPRVGCALLAGGGMRTGQVIGATNRLGEYATERPVHFQDVFATLYHNLGIDTNRATLRDFNGRPRFLVDHVQYKPLREVV
ncbi:MAG TPA: DUF1501 domain-containing protein [Pirellulaceae bacterium]|nr:DUF1501 domain-containing protein [Pirellulaceae bacterium]